MSPIWIAGNGAMVIAALICMASIYHKRRSMTASALPVWSIVLVLVTVLVTGLQFIYPAVLAALRRDLNGVRAGEVWRFVTPLFVQPGGIVQFAFNAFLLMTFLPLAEKLYGRFVVVFYFVPGIAGQLVDYAWNPTGGGSSPAAFGVVGGLLVYVLRNRTHFPLWVSLAATAGIVAAVLLSAVRDGHGPSLLMGAVIAFSLPPPKVADGLTGPAERTDDFL